MAETDEKKASFVASRTPTEEILAGICADVLGLPRVGVHDNFFEIGGHSLLATQVISRIREAFQVELPVRTLFEAPTVGRLAECVEASRLSGERQVAPPILPAPRSGSMPVSLAQQRVWIVDQLSPGGNASYNIPVAAHLSGALDVPALERSLSEIVRRHETLRTTFAMERGAPVQVIAPPTPVALPVIDLADRPEADRMPEALRQAAEDLRTPFHLAQGPLLRVRLFRISPEEHLLFMVSHHIVSDGWSISVFNQELAAIYEAFAQGRPSTLPDLPAQYADYAVWQHRWLHGDVLEGQMAYWKQQLANAPTQIDLPTDRPRPPVQSFRGARHTFELTPELAEEVKVFSQAQGATLYMTLLAAFKALLSSYTGADDIVVGSPTAGRTRVETEAMIGFFINTLVLRTSLADSPSFSQLLRRVREVVLGATAHQEVQFDRIVEMLRPPRDRSRNPVFQVNFRVHTAPPTPVTLPGLTARTVDVLEFATSKFDLALDLTAVDGLNGYMEYNTDLFDPDTIARVRQDFEETLKAVLRQPTTPLASLGLPRSPLKRAVAQG
jgi:acyl carrier protein